MDRNRKQRHKNIAYLSLQSTREGTAGYAHVHEIVRGLRSRGWQIDLFEPSYHGNRNATFIQRITQFFCVQLKLWSVLKHVRLVYFRSHVALLPSVLLCWLKNVPYIQEINGPYEDLFIAWPFTRRFQSIIKYLFRFQFRLAAGLITVTPQLRQWITIESGVKSVAVVPNGANADLFRPEAVTSFSCPKPYALFFGALAQWQGIDTILNAFESPKWPSALNLVIAGDGMMKKNIKTFCQHNPGVTFLGTVPYRDIPGLIVNSMVGLSVQNNIRDRSATGLFPLKVFETMACGVPVIVSDFPGQADLVRDCQCGLVVPAENEKELANAVAFLHRHPHRCREMGMRGFQAINQQHSWNHRAAETEKVIEQTLFESKRKI